MITLSILETGEVGYEADQPPSQHYIDVSDPV